MDYKIIGNNLLAHLKRQNKTQTDLANHLNKSKQSVNNIINGKNKIKLGELIAILDYLELELYDIIKEIIDPQDELKKTHLYAKINESNQYNFIFRLLDNLLEMRKMSNSNIDNTESDYQSKKLNTELSLLKKRYIPKYSCNQEHYVFEILKSMGSLLMYPLEGEKFLGYYLNINGENIFFINTSVIYENQIVVGGILIAYAQSIFHINEAEVTTNILEEYFNNKESYILEEYLDNEESYILDSKIKHKNKLAKNKDLLIKEFTLELILDSKHLLSKYYAIPKDYDLYKKVALLSHHFIIQPEIIINRLSKLKLLSAQDLVAYRDDQSSILSNLECYSNRKNLRIHNKMVSKITNLDDYLDLVVTLNELKLLSFKDYNQKLELVNIPLSRISVAQYFTPEDNLEMPDYLFDCGSDNLDDDDLIDYIEIEW